MVSIIVFGTLALASKNLIRNLLSNARRIQIFLENLIGIRQLIMATPEDGEVDVKLNRVLRNDEAPNTHCSA